MSHESELEYAGFWSRVGATLIDTVLMALVTVPLLFSIYGRDWLQTQTFVAGPAEFFVSYVLPAVIVIAFWARYLATPGKMAIGAEIVDARTGAKPRTTQLIVRYIGYYVSMLPLFLGYIWVAFDRRKQGWHDKLAGTVVVRRKGDEQVRFEQPLGKP